MEGNKWFVWQGIRGVAETYKNLLLEGIHIVRNNIWDKKDCLSSMIGSTQKIHACPNDYILCRGEEYKNLDAYPIYKACRYKIPHDDPDDIERVHTKKKLLAKVMWYSLRDKKKQVNNWCEYDICEFMHNLSKCGRITT